MGEGTCVLAELAGAQSDHIVDPFDRMGPHIARELLVAENGQTFLEAELEPIAAGDAVARPVVKVFVGDDRLNPFKVRVG